MIAASLAIATMTMTLTISAPGVGAPRPHAGSIFRLPTAVPMLAQSGPPVFGQPRIGHNPTVVRIAAISAAALGGFFAGGIIGAEFDRNCRCDDPGLRGFVIGAPIGAIASGIAAAILIK
jgi:hypothetical protein